MFNTFERFSDKGMVIAVFIGIVVIAISGMWFALTYLVLNNVQTAFESTDCVIPNNTLVGSCQELFQLALYPILNLKDLLVWISFFFIFALVIGMLVLGYRAGNSPVLMGYLVAVVIAMTYLSIEISNLYRDLILNDIFRAAMVEFPVYSRIMLSFPWFVFIVTLMSLLLGIVNYQRSPVNKVTDELNY